MFARHALLLAVMLLPAVVHSATVTGKLVLPPPPAMHAVARYGGAVVHPGPPSPAVGVVYLEGPNVPDPLPVPAQPYELRQEGLQFHPAVLPIMVGSSVVFPNMDDTYHNVFSYSPAGKFDLGRYKKDEAPPVRTFDEPGEIRLYCEVHEHMRATILVLPTPWFVATDADGNFSLPDIPPGTYQATAWYNPKKQATTTLVIPEGADTVTLSFKK